MLTFLREKGLIRGLCLVALQKHTAPWKSGPSNVQKGRRAKKQVLVREYGWPLELTGLRKENDICER